MFKRGRDVESFNYWERSQPEVDLTPDFLYYCKHLATKRLKLQQKDDNLFLDIHTKKAALRVSPVVALISYSGEEELSQGCGTIIQVDDSNTGIVLTSANLIRHPTQEVFVQHALADNLKVKKKKCGDGGPVINHSGEVIGVAFYEVGFTPVMPINIVMKSWEHHKNFGDLCRPYVGMKATNFHAAAVDLAEKIIQRFPSISKGVLVEKVNSGSAAHSAGLRPNDIIQCAGKPVQGFLEVSGVRQLTFKHNFPPTSILFRLHCGQLFEMMWDNVGRRVNLAVLRADQVTPSHLEMMVSDATPNELYSWPHHD